MNLLALLPGRDWLYICAFMVLLGGGIGFVHHEREIGAERVEKVRQAETAQRAAVAAAWAASSASETQRRKADQKESDHEADRFTALADAGHVHAVDAGQRLQQRFAAADACRLPGGAAAVAASPPASAAVDLRADVLRRVVQAAGQFAAIADARGIAGADAERQYDTLSLPRGLSPAGP